MHHGMSKHQEKGFLPGGLNALHGLPGVLFGQVVDVDMELLHIVSPQEHLGRHIVAVGDSQITVKTLVQRQESFTGTHVPLPDIRSRIPPGFEHLRKGGLFRSKTGITVGIKHGLYTHPTRIPTRQEASPGGTGDGRCAVTVCKTDSVGGQRVDVAGRPAALNVCLKYMAFVD